MMGRDAAAVRAIILSRLAPALGRLGLTAAHVADDFDLRAEGVIDSLGFVELLAEVERQCGCPVELDELDPDQLTVVGPLSAYIAKRWAPAVQS